uniref:Uncharacterized protein n=1 Tax=Arundo donax TaxID=35708 RepID=A0A0A9FI29_ARUDO
MLCPEPAAGAPWRRAVTVADAARRRHRERRRWRGEVLSIRSAIAAAALLASAVA